MIILVSDNVAIQISVKQIKKVQAMEDINNYILIYPKDEVGWSNRLKKLLFGIHL